MTVIRLSRNSLFLHSPVPLDLDLRTALSSLGQVRAIVAPSKVHHLFEGDYLSAYPDAKRHGAPGLPEKRKDLVFDSILSDEAHPDWRDQIDQHLFCGAPVLNEVVFFHRATRTAIFTDLVFNISKGVPKMRIVDLLTGAVGHFGPHRRLRRRGITERDSARESVGGILEWDFDRVIMSHGEVLKAAAAIVYGARSPFFDSLGSGCVASCSSEIRGLDLRDPNGEAAARLFSSVERQRAGDASGLGHVPADLDTTIRPLSSS